jgi:hypothetical protein
VTILTVVVDKDPASKAAPVPSHESRSLQSNRSPWAKQIRGALSAWETAREATIEATIEIGKLLIAARKNLKQGEFIKMIKNDLPFSRFTANKLMKIARDPRIVAHVKHLPPHWGTLYEIALLRDEFYEALERGIIHPDAQRKDITEFRNEVKNRERRRIFADLAETLPPVTDRFELHNKSCEELLKGLPAIANIVFADPPYGKDWLEHDLLGRTAAHVLKPGGSFLAMVGHVELPDALNAFRKHLNYQWLQAYYYQDGPQTISRNRRVRIGFKPILWFTRGSYSGSVLNDVVTCPFDKSSKSLHKWGQSKYGMQNLLAPFIKPGDTVVDLCMGSGTTGVAALELDARFIGYDPDKAAYNAALARLNRWTSTGAGPEGVLLTKKVA